MKLSMTWLKKLLIGAVAGVLILLGLLLLWVLFGFLRPHVEEFSGTTHDEFV